MSAESKPSSFEAVLAAFAFVATFALGYGQWRLAIRQNEQDVKIERQREEFQRSLLEALRDADEKRAADSLELQVITLVSPHLPRLRESGREASTSQRIVTAAAELLSARGRPGLSQMADRIREKDPPAAGSNPPAAVAPLAEAPSPANVWLVLLATLPGDDLKIAEGVANDKLRAAKDLGMTPAVSIYRTRIKGRYVVALGKPLGRAAALELAAQARRKNLSADAFAEPDGGWELTGTAPFPAQIKSASVEQDPDR
jgi:hypothetical protein